jgi:hypothetical protein
MRLLGQVHVAYAVSNHQISKLVINGFEVDHVLDRDDAIVVAVG